MKGRGRAEKYRTTNIVELPVRVPETLDELVLANASVARAKAEDRNGEGLWNQAALYYNEQVVRMTMDCQRDNSPVKRYLACTPGRTLRELYGTASRQTAARRCRIPSRSLPQVLGSTRL